MSPAFDDSVERYRYAVMAAARRDLGRELSEGTTVVASASRQGSPTAVAYPLGERTLVWCSQEIAPALEPLARDSAMSIDEFVQAAAQLGGVHVGSGNHRVLSTRPNASAHRGFELISLRADDDVDRLSIAAFIDACSDDDLDEAELELDALDPAIVALKTSEGVIVSYASARPWDMEAQFDDVAVITHPNHRGNSLGSIVVAELARRQQAVGRRLFYSCGVDNHGSNRVAESVGFELVATVAGVTFH